MISVTGSFTINSNHRNVSLPVTNPRTGLASTTKANCTVILEAEIQRINFAFFWSFIVCTPTLVKQCVPLAIHQTLKLKCYEIAVLSLPTMFTFFDNTNIGTYIMPPQSIGLPLKPKKKNPCLFWTNHSSLINYIQFTIKSKYSQRHY